eukprot:115692-Chlamydomonas_euryale.AAC.1
MLHAAPRLVHRQHPTSRSRAPRAPHAGSCGIRISAAATAAVCAADAAPVPPSSLPLPPSPLTASRSSSRLRALRTRRRVSGVPPLPLPLPRLPLLPPLLLATAAEPSCLSNGDAAAAAAGAAAATATVRRTRTRAPLPRAHLAPVTEPVSGRRCCRCCRRAHKELNASATEPVQTQPHRETGGAGGGCNDVHAYMPRPDALKA